MGNGKNQLLICPEGYENNNRVMKEWMISPFSISTNRRDCVLVSLSSLQLPQHLSTKWASNGNQSFESVLGRDEF